MEKDKLIQQVRIVIEDVLGQLAGEVKQAHKVSWNAKIGCVASNILLVC